MWKKACDIIIKSYSKFHFDALVTEEGMGVVTWQMTCLYGHPKTVKKKDTWGLLRSLRREGMAWLVFGDLNELLNRNEKSGGRKRPEKQMRNLDRLLMIMS